MKNEKKKTQILLKKVITFLSSIPPAKMHGTIFTAVVEHKTICAVYLEVV